MANKKAHPLDDLSFDAPKLNEIASDEAPQPALNKKIKARASNITLPVSTWEWIDAKHTEARSKGGKPLRKSAIIRALFEVAMSVDIDLSGVQSEDEIVERMVLSIRQSS